jgi:hypothetical protein
MQTRTLGKQGLTVSAIGYCAMGTAFAYSPSDDTEDGRISPSTPGLADAATPQHAVRARGGSYRRRCPGGARHVAEILRRCFAAAEARSYPAGADGGTRLHLTVDTTRVAEPVRSWLLTSQSSRDDHTQPDEI